MPFNRNVSGACFSHHYRFHKYCAYLSLAYPNLNDPEILFSLLLLFINGLAHFPTSAKICVTLMESIKCCFEPEFNKWVPTATVPKRYPV